MLHRRLDFVCRPTPLHPLARISDLIGADLWIKRDDLTGFAGSGNKGRKLEYLLFDALEAGAQDVVTSGAAQSNFVRQAAAACKVHGLDFHAVVMHWPHPPGRSLQPGDWTAPTLPTGNLLLGEILEADIRIVPDGTWDALDKCAADIARELEEQGRRVYVVPSGGSSGVGALGFVSAAEEVLQEQPTFDRVVVASGSGSTQTGLTYGFARSNSKTHVTGICTDDEPEMAEDFEKIAVELDFLLGDNLKLCASDFDLRFGYAGDGYQMPTEQAQSALKLMAHAEGIFLDSVYTSKAFAGLLDMAKNGELRGRTLFWHTGGLPSLFA